MEERRCGRALDLPNRSATMDGMSNTAPSGARLPAPRWPRVSPEPGSRRDRGLLLFGVLAAYAVLYAAWLLTSKQPPSSRSFRNDLAFLPVGLIPTLLALRAARARSLDPATRRAWKFLSAAFAFLWLGDILWFAGVWLWPGTPLGLHRGPGRVRRPLPAAAARPLLLPALSADALGVPAVLARRRDRFPRRPDGPLDGPARPDHESSVGQPRPLSGDVGYVMGDLVLIFGLGVVAVRRRGESARFVLLPLAIGIAAMLLNDAVSSVSAAAAEPYLSGTSVDLIGMIAWLLFGASAAAQGLRRRRARPSGSRPTRRAGHDEPDAVPGGRRRIRSPVPRGARPADPDARRHRRRRDRADGDRARAAGPRRPRERPALGRRRRPRERGPVPHARPALLD